MKLFRKILIYMLSFILVAVPVFLSYSHTVYAAQAAEIIDGVKKALRVLSFMLSSTGTVVSTERVQDFYDTYKERIDTILTGGVTVTEKGEYICSGASVEEIRTLFDEYLSSTPEVLDVVWVPVITEKNLKASWFSCTESYYKAMSIFTQDNAPSLIGMYTSGYKSGFDDYIYSSNGVNYRAVSYVDLSNANMYINGTFDDAFLNGLSLVTSSFGNDSTTALWNYAYFVDANGISVTPSWNYIGASDDLSHKAAGRCTFNPFFHGTLSPTNGWCNYIYLVASSNGGVHYVPVFSTANAYKNWITGQGNYYKFDSGYAGGDITINPDADYSQITDAIQNAMQQAVQSGKNMTDALSDMQKALTTALNKLNGTFGDIEDNTNAANEWLEKIYNKLVEVYGEDAADTWLEMNENLDRIYEKLNEIYSEDESAAFNILIDSVRGTRNLLLLFYDRNHDDIEHFELVFEAVLSGVVGKLEESNTWLEKIYNRVDDIYDKVKAILFVDTVDAAFDIFSKVWDSITEWIENKYEVLGIMTEAAQVGNVMKTKFPFSIPWDVYAILMMFDAPAKPPIISLHWEMPFLGEDYAFDYEYVMDEQMWINLSAVCRFFLIISYDITLIHLTQKLYAAGLFDVPAIGRRKR